MTKRDILSIAIIILGLQNLFFAISMMIVFSHVSAPALLYPELDLLEMLRMQLPTMLFIVIDIFLGLFFLLKSEKISSFILKEDSEIKIQSITGNETQIIAITLLLIGLYFSFNSTVGFAMNITNYFVNPEIVRGNVVLYKPTISFSSAISLIFGLTLSLKAKKIANWFCGVNKFNDRMQADE